MTKTETEISLSKLVYKIKEILACSGYVVPMEFRVIGMYTSVVAFFLSTKKKKNLHPCKFVIKKIRDKSGILSQISHWSLFRVLNISINITIPIDCWEVESIQYFLSYHLKHIHH